MSVRHTPHARTRRRSCPASGLPISRSTSRSGLPAAASCIARISYPVFDARTRAIEDFVTGCSAGHGLKYKAREEGSGRPDGFICNRRLAMFAIVYKSDGVPICVQVPGVSPDPVVVWNSESAAKAFIASKGGGGEFQPVSVNEQAMEKMAKALGCPVEKLMREPYPS